MLPSSLEAAIPLLLILGEFGPFKSLRSLGRVERTFISAGRMKSKARSCKPWDTWELKVARKDRQGD